MSGNIFCSEIYCSNNEGWSLRNINYWYMICNNNHTKGRLGGRGHAQARSTIQLVA